MYKIHCWVLNKLPDSIWRIILSMSTPTKPYDMFEDFRKGIYKREWVAILDEILSPKPKIPLLTDKLIHLADLNVAKELIFHLLEANLFTYIPWQMSWHTDTFPGLFYRTLPCAKVIQAQISCRTTILLKRRATETITWRHADNKAKRVKTVTLINDSSINALNINSEWNPITVRYPQLQADKL